MNLTRHLDCSRLEYMTGPISVLLGERGGSYGQDLAVTKTRKLLHALNSFNSGNNSVDAAKMAVLLELDNFF